MIIGIAGSFCSGKNVMGMLFAEKGFEVISTADLLRAEMRNKGIEVTRENIQIYVRRMREKVGLAYPTNLVPKTLEEGKNYIIADLRNDSEVVELSKIGGFFLIAIDAPETVRFERMKARSREEDPSTFEDFKKIEEMELYGRGEGSFGFNISAAMKMADRTITNDGSVEELRGKVEELLEELRGN